MAAIILGWNPDVWNGWDYESVVNQVDLLGEVNGEWSVGRHVNIHSGTDAWLYRQGKQETGLIGHGLVTSQPYVDKHYSDETKATNYVKVRFDALLPIGMQVPKDELRARVPGVAWDSIFQSGWFVGEQNEDSLRRLWLEHASLAALDPAVPVGGTFLEGTVARVLVNSYERRRQARDMCISVKGAVCLACGFSFEDAYGEAGRGFIHVHHVVPVSQLGPGYELDPVADLVPLCANCHAMAHRGVHDPRSVEELRGLLRRRAQGR